MTRSRGGLSAALRIKAFRRFWIGFTFSGIGDAITKTSLVWYVLTRTGSTVDVGLLLLTYAGPVAVGGLLAGHLLDQFDRRTVMLVDSLVRGAAVSSIPVAAATGHLSLGQVYFVAGIYGFLFMISLAGAPSVIPSLVPETELTAANALETLAFTLQGVAGPAIGGLLIAAVGAPYALIVDCISYLAFAVVLAPLDLRDPHDPATADESPLQLADALRLLLHNRALLSTTLMFMAFNAGEGFLQVWLPVQARTIEPAHGAPVYGALFAVMATGETIGALSAAHLMSRRTEGQRICLAQTLAGLALALALLDRTLWAIGTGLLLCGFFSAPMTAWAQTLRMRIIPPRLRGRTFALLRTLMQSSAPAFSGIGGALLTVVGLRALIGMSVSLIAIPGLLGTRVHDLAAPPPRAPTVGEMNR
jgi:MFS family permease